MPPDEDKDLFDDLEEDEEFFDELDDDENEKHNK
jgi:hypothetical protein